MSRVLEEVSQRLVEGRGYTISCVTERTAGMRDLVVRVSRTGEAGMKEIRRSQPTDDEVFAEMLRGFEASLAGDA